MANNTTRPRSNSKYGSDLTPAAQEPVVSRVLFVRDDHTSTAQQLLLCRELPRFSGLGGQLWLEFFTNMQLLRVKKALESPSRYKDKDVLEAVRAAVSSNGACSVGCQKTHYVSGWSDEYNESLMQLLRVAHTSGMSVYALDEPEWGLVRYHLHGKA